MKILGIKILDKRVIGEESNPLLIRYILFRFSKFGIFVHKLCRSDYDRALHDHPWTFLSVILKNGYDELTDTGLLKHHAGSVLYRPATWSHRVIIREGKPSWNLVFVGPKVRRWGFWLNNKWCWWRKYDYNLAICSEDILWDGDE